MKGVHIVLSVQKNSSQIEDTLTYNRNLLAYMQRNNKDESEVPFTKEEMDSLQAVIDSLTKAKERYDKIADETLKKETKECGFVPKGETTFYKEAMDWVDSHEGTKAITNTKGEEYYNVLRSGVLYAVYTEVHNELKDYINSKTQELLDEFTKNTPLPYGFETDLKKAVYERMKGRCLYFPRDLARDYLKYTRGFYHSDDEARIKGVHFTLGYDDIEKIWYAKVYSTESEIMVNPTEIACDGTVQMKEDLASERENEEEIDR